MFLQHACDYNAAPKDNQIGLGFDRGSGSVGRHCLYRKSTPELSFDYLEEFWDTYKGKRKFATVIIESGHSFYERNHEFIDEDLIKFLTSMEAKGNLENTIVQLYSDHGDHLHVFWEYTPSGMIEKTHPASFMILP
jgi:hypothetical protein